jgi:hypothetical protein
VEEVVGALAEVTLLLLPLLPLVQAVTLVFIPQAVVEVQVRMAVRVPPEVTELLAAMLLVLRVVLEVAVVELPPKPLRQVVTAEPVVLAEGAAVVVELV